MGNLLKDDRTTQAQHSTTALSGQGQAAQQIGMRFLLNLMGQGGPQSWQDYVAAGSRGRQAPAMPISLQEQNWIDPGSVNMQLYGQTHPYTPGGTFALQGQSGQGVQKILASHPELNHGYTPTQANPQNLTMLDLLRAYQGGGGTG